MVRGTVQGGGEDSLLVLGRAGLIRATRAESCLLTPEKGDTVLMALLDDGSAWVLAVLQRKGKGACTIAFPEKSTLSAPSLTVSSTETRISASSFSLQGEDILIEGKSLGLSARVVQFCGAVLIQGFSVVRTLCRSLSEQIFRRTGHYGSLEEKVEELSRHEAGRVRLSSDTSFRMRAENADLRAEKQMDIDATQIKVG